MADSSSVDVPEKIGPYRIEARLGVGGMGHVYRAFDERLHRQVALKQIRPDRVQQSRARQRFLREARATARLNHPAIVHVHDIVEAEGSDWIVMELAEGQPLSKVLERGPLDPREVLQLALEVAAGLQAAHAEGIIHRDLKTENIIVTSQGHAKILDFGLAKELEQLDFDPSISVDGQVLGTPRAMSPEQARGEKVDHRSDLFSLGTLLYEMLTGTSPFRGTSATNTLLKVCMHQPAPVDESVDGMPDAFSSLVDRLLQKEPDSRPQSATEVIASLQEVAALFGNELSMGVRRVVARTDQALPLDETRASHPELPPRTSTAELRQVTVLCCDLVSGDESSSGSIDPESLFEVMAEFTSLAREAVEHFEGHLGSALGHRLVVYFGYPLAHEDDARRAVHAALEIVHRAEESTATESGIPLAVRVAIHTGLAVSVPGTRQLALGQTLDLATGLQSLADPNTVIVSSDTHHLVASFFTTERLLPARPAGHNQDLERYRILGLKDVESRLEITALGQLVGRERELDLLMSRWQLVREEMGQVVLVSGEAGIGKSRLVQGLKGQLMADQPTWLVTHGSPYTGNSPLDPVVELIRRILKISPEDSPKRGVRQIRDLLERFELPLHEALPAIASLLSVPLDRQYPTFESSPEKQRRITQETLVELILKMAEEQPVVLVVEDLQWTDPSTQELLGLLIDQTEAVPLLLVLTYRMEFEPPWGQRSFLTQLNLNRLSGQQTEELIDRATRGKSLPAEVRRQVIARTDGVPLFVEELIKALIDSGQLVEHEDRFELAGSMNDLFVPATLRDSLTARLDGLGQAKEVAQLAAAMGREFSFELLAAVAPWSEAILEKELERLVAAELVRRKGFSRRARYIFKHALIQDAAYGSLLRPRRREIHQSIAEALRERFPEQVEHSPQILAHHFDRSGFTREAASYYHLAGQQAAQRSAYVEATRYFAAGLEVVSRLPLSKARHEREVELLSSQAMALIALKGYGAEDVEQNCQRAWELCQELGETPQLLPVLFGLLTFHLNRANREPTGELLERILDLAGKTTDSTVQRIAWAAAGHHAFYAGNLRQAQELYGRVLEEQMTATRGHPAPNDPFVLTQLYMGTCMWFRGLPEQALEYQDIDGEECTSFDLAHVLSSQAGLAQYRGEPHRVRELADRVVELAREHNFPQWLAIASILRGWARIGEEGGLEELLDGLAQFRATGSLLPLSYYLACRVEAHLKMGQIDEGLEVVEEALGLAKHNLDVFYEAELHRLRGELLLRRPEPSAEEAEICFGRALEIARRQEARSLELRAATSLARMLAGGDRAGEGRACLAAIYETFSEGFGTRDLREARELLETG